MPKEKIKQLIRYHKIKAWYETYERILMPVTLVFGVIVDTLTFQNIDVTLAFILLGVYVVLAGSIILYLNAYDTQKISQNKSFFRYLRLAAPLCIQFLFGALLSGVFIFYLFSGTLFVSWPFIAIIVLLMIANDAFRHYYLKPTIQISVYYFILFSLTSIILPFTFETFGPKIFITSGILSIVLITAYITLLCWIVPPLKQKRHVFGIAIVTLCIVINGFYALNIIPPIPLSLRDAAVVHDIRQVGGEYILDREEESFWQKLIPGQIIHIQPGERVYVYTAIFAPGQLHTNIIHHWQYYDTAQNTWVTKDRLSFFITGGRKEGYRGYSVKTTVPAGSWRVNVETERGQTVGRVQFRVIETP